jgi:acetyl esterase/lipase
MRSRVTIPAMLALALLASGLPASAAYAPVQHRTELAEGEIAVTEPGNCGKEGATYVLMNDISAPTTALFLANNVTLDLNGYTVTYAAGNYQHATNYSFEDGLEGFDVSKAPGAKVSDTQMTHPLDGKMTCLLPKDEEIVSSWVELPVANRTYYATAMVADSKQYVTISVEDEQGKPVECTFKYSDKTRVTCPANSFPPKLGGGTVYAMIYGQPAGKYRVRVKAIGRDAVIDCVDLHPAMDVGVGIVGRVVPWAYYKCVLDGDGPPAFFDYLKEGSTSEPVATVPHVTGSGTVTVKNGVIVGGFRTIDSRGILCSASDVKTVVENVKLVSAGIDANAVAGYQGVMKDCRVEVDTPFIINRHQRAAVACWWRGPKPTEISGCEFIGGQGCVTLNGSGGLIHDSIFRGRQTVTNHYCLCLDATGAKVYNNRFEPIIGSGISILGKQNNEMYDNTFEIVAAPPDNEYSNTDYSTNAVRITDYGNKKGSPKGWCEGNKVYRNKIHVTAKAYEGASKNYIAVATAIFMSVGGGENDFYDNEVTVDDQTPDNKGSEAYAIYVGGSDEGGKYWGNTITSNVQPVWISCRYGQAKNVEMYDNTFVKAEGADPYVPIQCGYYKHPSENVGFFSNKFVGLDFGVKIGDYTTKSSQYAFGWTLTVNAPNGTEVAVLTPDGEEVASKKAGADRQVVFHLPEYKVKGSEKTECGDYMVKVGDLEKKVSLTSDTTLTYTKEPPRLGSGKAGLQVTKIIGFTSIPYSNVHERCMLDVFRPADDERAPLVICIHGGGWEDGDRIQYHQTCIELARQGYAAATIGYRLMDTAVWPEMGYDVLKGMAYLSAHAGELGIDASKAVTLGSSAGGQLALVMQAKAAQWAEGKVVPVVPDIVGTVAQCPAIYLAEPGQSDRADKLRNGSAMDEFSPGHMEAKLFRSVLVVHGDADKTIPIDESRRFVKSLSDAGVPAEIIVLPGVDHAFAYRLNNKVAMDALEMTYPYIKGLLNS